MKVTEAQYQAAIDVMRAHRRQRLEGLAQITGEPRQSPFEPDEKVSVMLAVVDLILPLSGALGNASGLHGAMLAEGEEECSHSEAVTYLEGLVECLAEAGEALAPLGRALRVPEGVPASSRRRFKVVKDV